ncbi:geminin-like [Adelges cooleyi]|uniref:geminin-like n=1 Tax=Adelges cooleyi TaxID=133065 RepID=UPI0021807AAE|nr:geminin-like [Adelges cooleyi]
MKTALSENAPRTRSGKVSVQANNKNATRKCLQTLQPSGRSKENLVGSGRSQEKIDQKTSKSLKTTEAKIKSKDKKLTVPKVDPSLYQKLIIEDLTSTAGPSEKYWQAIAERRKKALEEVLEDNRKLHSLVMALEDENTSCKNLLEETTDLVNTLKEILYEASNEECVSDDENDTNGNTEVVVAEDPQDSSNITLSNSDSE